MTNEEAIKRLESTKDFLREKHSEEIKSDVFRKYPELKEIENDTYKNNQTAFDIAISALRAQQPNAPLTLEQLKERMGKPIYVKHWGWEVLQEVVLKKDLIFGRGDRECLKVDRDRYLIFDDFCFYDHEPKEG